MKYKSIILVTALLCAELFAQNFNVKAKGKQTFSLGNELKNQATFFSTTPLEDVEGIANGVTGSVSFDLSNFGETLTGLFEVKVASMKTGIELRDQHLRSANWLDEEEYPLIKFEVVGAENIKQVSDNKIEADVKGSFSLHGVTRGIIAKSTITYLDENEETKKRAPGDLLVIKSTFEVKLSEYEVENNVIGSKVAEDIEVTVNLVGSNK